MFIIWLGVAAAAAELAADYSSQQVDSPHARRCLVTMQYHCHHGHSYELPLNERKIHINKLNKNLNNKEIHRMSNQDGFVSFIYEMLCFNTNGLTVWPETHPFPFN
jgi:hypothetical protein